MPVRDGLFEDAVSAIEDDDPDSVVDAASTSGCIGPDQVFGCQSSGNARKAIDKFKSENPHVEISRTNRQRPGVHQAGLERMQLVVGAHFAVMAEDGVQDSVTYYDS